MHALHIFLHTCIYICVAMRNPYPTPTKQPLPLMASCDSHSHVHVGAGLMVLVAAPKGLLQLLCALNELGERDGA